MAFNTLKYLEKGKVEFVSRLTPYDFKSLIINVRNSERRELIVKGFIDKLLDIRPRFCLLIIYDMPEYFQKTEYLLNNYFKVEFFSKEEIEAFLTNSKAATKYLIENFQDLISIYKDDLDFIFSHLINNKEEYKDLLKEIAFSKNLKLRYQFMKYIIINNPELISYFYDDISKYLTSDNYQENEQISLFRDLMDAEDISELAFLIFDSAQDYDTYLKVKEFILKNYPTNSLAKHLLKPKKKLIGEYSYQIVDNELGISEFQKDPDTYFKSANRGRLSIYRYHGSKISKELLEEYKSFLSYFRDDDRNLSDVDDNGLSNKLEAYLEKYLDLSTDKTHEFIESGSTTSCYRVGDYVFKLSSTKWSYEEIICPDLYLILKNLEEIFIRDKNGIVVAGIEVQRYLKRDAKNIPEGTLKLFSEELSRLGYYTTDSLMDGPCGDNCRLLDDYRDSGELNPPKWFKKTPLVLVDRDRVYKKENIYPKQLRPYY